jgi:hypothetical protein
VVGDAAYVGEHLRGLDTHITWTSRLKVTSVPHEPPPPRTGRWYTTKTEPSYDDMIIKLRRVIIAARFRGPCPELATPEETRAVLAA